MLLGVSRMLGDIIALAIANEPDMVLVDTVAVPDEHFAARLHRKHIDVVIYSAAATSLSEAQIADLLLSSPRTGLIEVNGEDDSGVLHRLVVLRDAIKPLTQPNLSEAIRAAAALRH